MVSQPNSIRLDCPPAQKQKAVKHARDGKGPSLIEAKTYRFFGHHPNDPAEYRTREEEDRYKKEKDPVANFEKILLREKIISKKDIEEMEKDILMDIEKAVDFARKSPEPDLEIYFKEVKQI